VHVVLTNVLLRQGEIRFLRDCVLTDMSSFKDFDSITRAIGEFSKTAMTSSEANTKTKIIERLLGVLGWNVHSNYVMLEYPIKIGSTTKYVDYALMLENKPVALVEAKPFDTALSPDDSAQIISYGRIEDVHWVVLTNGKGLKIFDAMEGKGEKECLVIEIDLSDASAHARDLNIISRESIISGDIDAAIKRLAATRKAMKSLEERQSEMAEAFKGVLLKITGPEAEKRVSSISAQLAREAVRLFRGQSEAGPGPVPTPDLRQIYRSELAAKPLAR
jgi:hypothetical protein